MRNTSDEIEPYGKYKAKLSEELLDRIDSNKDETDTSYRNQSNTWGEGKTTTTVGLDRHLIK